MVALVVRAGIRGGLGSSFMNRIYWYDVHIDDVAMLMFIGLTAWLLHMCVL